MQLVADNFSYNKRFLFFYVFKLRVFSRPNTIFVLLEIYECFNSIDIDGSGSISSIELHKTINLFKNNISLKDAEEIIEDIDTDSKIC